MTLLTSTLLLLTTLVVSCGGYSTRDLSTVRELTKEESTKCEAIMHVESQTLTGDPLMALRDLKREVLRKKGNAYRITETIENGKKIRHIATVFECLK